ncbi:MAG: DUF799 family lipoprotein [Nitrospirae bacterium]|nr:DUF799 family lipoprotein [Nitrospirota bacterium]
MLKKQVCSLAAITLVTVMAGCHPPSSNLPRDYGNPIKRVAVLTMKNDTNDVDGPDVMRKKMAQALEQRSYVVKDLKETDQILRDRMGITLGGQLSLTTAEKLGQELGVEGVLYGTLMDFNETTLGAINVRKVRGKFKLVNTMTGQTVWERGLGVRSELVMHSQYGAAAAIAARAVDARDKDVPWVTVETMTTGRKNLGESFAIGLGTKLLSQAIGKHLDHESTELARRVTDNLHWGPGPGAVATMPSPKIVMPEIKMPEPPSFGYMDWEGKRDFSAVLYSVSFDKNRNEPFSMEIPIAVAFNRMRMDMDLSKMNKGDSASVLSKMILITRGDKKVSYTLYPDAQKYLVHTENEATEEKPRVEKTLVGSEVIDKHPTDKYKVKIIYKDGKDEEGFIWNAKDLNGMTIRSEVENKDYKVTTAVRNIIVKTPAAAMFEIPAGYTEAKGFMDLMAAEPKNK